MYLVPLHYMHQPSSPYSYPSSVILPPPYSSLPPLFPSYLRMTLRTHSLTASRSHCTSSQVHASEERQALFQVLGPVTVLPWYLYSRDPCLAISLFLPFPSLPLSPFSSLPLVRCWNCWCPCIRNWMFLIISVSVR